MSPPSADTSEGIRLPGTVRFAFSPPSSKLPLVASPSRFRVFIHRGTGNLGDAIQTIALCRILGPNCVGIYRDRPIPRTSLEMPLIVNGWLGYHAHDEASEAVFAGVHLARQEGAYARWIGHSKHVSGSRDPYTQGLLQTFGIRSEMIGCATLTFDRYRGIRRGRYSIDALAPEHVTPLTNRIPDIDWISQWTLASELLAILRHAEVVYTTRLHVALPCLAFGTPVVFPASGFERLSEKHRLSLLFGLSFSFDEPVTTDVRAVGEGYIAFLERTLGRVNLVSEAIMPKPVDG